MKSRIGRALATIAGVVVLALLLGAGAVSAIAPNAIPLFFWTMVETADPSRIAWEGKTGFARCDSAIAGRTTWPSAPEAFCRAVTMCANEAVLTSSEMERLRAIASSIPNCPSF